MRFERGKRRRTKARGEEGETCKRVETWVEPDWTEWTEVRGVAALDISVFSRSGLKLKSLAT
jgi:hypothetical protein